MHIPHYAGNLICRNAPTFNAQPPVLGAPKDRRGLVVFKPRNRRDALGSQPNRLLFIVHWRSQDLAHALYFGHRKCPIKGNKSRIPPHIR